MNTAAFLTIARSELDTFGLQDWTLEYTRAYSYAGRVQPHFRRFNFSKPFVQANSKHIVLNTLHHEIAHALLGHQAISIQHGPLWQLLAVSLGAQPSPYTPPESTMGGRWLRIHCTLPTCPNFTANYVTRRKPRALDTRHCRICNSPVVATPIPVTINEEV